jgi:hypothetical protein
MTPKIQQASSVTSGCNYWMASGLLWTNHLFSAKWKVGWGICVPRGFWVPERTVIGGNRDRHQVVRRRVCSSDLGIEGGSLFSDNPSGAGCNQVILTDSWPILRECQREGPAILTESKLNPGDVIKQTPRCNQATTSRGERRKGLSGVVFIVGAILACCLPFHSLQWVEGVKG